MAIGAIGRVSGAIAPASGDLTAASAADLRLLRGAFRSSGIDLATSDIAYARSTTTSFEAEVGLRGGHVVQPHRRADAALVIDMERHLDSGANVNAKVVDLGSGKVMAETRRVQLRPRPPYETSEDVEGQFVAITQALSDLKQQRAVVPDSPEFDRQAAVRLVPVSPRDVVLQAQATAAADMNLRGAASVGIQDLGENRRREEELAALGKGKGKGKGKGQGVGGGQGPATAGVGASVPGTPATSRQSQLTDLLGQVGGGNSSTNRGQTGRNVDTRA